MDWTLKFNDLIIQFQESCKPNQLIDVTKLLSNVCSKKCTSCLFSKKLPKYQNTVVFKYCTTEFVYLHQVTIV